MLALSPALFFPLCTNYSRFMSFSTQSVSDNTLVVHIGETLDFRNADAFKETVHAPVDAGKHQFILDFSDTDVLDSSGLGAIFSLYRRVAAHDGTVVFANTSEPVRVVVELTRTYKVFPQYDSVESAQAELT